MLCTDPIEQQLYSVLSVCVLFELPKVRLEN